MRALESSKAFQSVSPTQTLTAALKYAANYYFDVPLTTPARSSRAPTVIDVVQRILTAANPTMDGPALAATAAGMIQEADQAACNGRSSWAPDYARRH
jgi:hypothetical protein